MPMIDKDRAKDVMKSFNDATGDKATGGLLKKAKNFFGMEDDSEDETDKAVAQAIARKSSVYK